jgi:predicted acyl esterase
MNKNWRELISQPKYGIKVQREINVPMRDGVNLSVNVFLPDASGKFPALLAIGGYGKELQECLIPPQPQYRSAVWDGNIEAGDTTEIVPRGYVHVIGDVRGTGTSEGEYPGMWSQQEGMDGHDLVEWIAQQPWCDGNVGMIGYSYYGGMQLKVAIQQPPHLKAIFPSHIFADFYDMAYGGGVLSLFLYGLWDGRHGTSGCAPNNAVSKMMKTLPKEEFERRRQELLNHPDIKNYPNLFHLLHYPQKNPFFFDMVMNPYNGPYWQERSVYPYYDKIEVPTHCVGKLGVGSGYWDIYNGIKSPHKKLLVKPHGPEERPWREDIEDLIRWHDHWLKGNDTGMMDEPPIKMFVPGINQWRYEKEWPLPNIEYTKCYLRRWEGLSFEPELYQDEPDCFLQQPLHLSTKRDSVIYVSPPLSEDLEVMGWAAFHFFASIDQDDAHFIARVSDVAPNGAEMSVGGGTLKASHRALDPEKSRPERPYHPHTRESVETIKPGEIYEYNVSLGMMVNIFRAGHRIKLMIHSMVSPRDPDVQIHYHPLLNSSKTTLHKIYRNREYRSHLLLPVIPGKQGIPATTLRDDNFL